MCKLGDLLRLGNAVNDGATSIFDKFSDAAIFSFRREPFSAEGVSRPCFPAHNNRPAVAVPEGSNRQRIAVTYAGFFAGGKAMNVHWTEVGPSPWRTAAANAKPAEIVAEILRSAHRIRGVLAAHFAEFGLSDARFAVLQIVRQSLPRGCTQTELAERLQQSESSISTLVDRMRAADLLYRLRSKSDRRKCLLVLTDHARDVMEKLERCHNERMAELLSCYQSDQLREMAGLLKVLDAELTRREMAGTDPRPPIASAVIPHPRLNSDVAEAALRPAG
jgi:DNA-binding MarR family transcriptional regulator